VSSLPQSSKASATPPRGEVPTQKPGANPPDATDEAGRGLFGNIDPDFAGYTDPSDPFYIDPSDRDKIIDFLSRQVDKWGLNVPATFTLTMGLPASFVAGQAMTLFASPFLSPIFGRKRVRDWENFLHDRKNVERLIQRLESDQEKEITERRAKRAERKAQKQARREAKRRKQAAPEVTSASADES
jgi:hypothetical protein